MTMNKHRKTLQEIDSLCF